MCSEKAPWRARTPIVIEGGEEGIVWCRKRSREWESWRVLG